MRAFVRVTAALVAAVSLSLSPVARGGSASGSLAADPIAEPSPTRQTNSPSSLQWSYCGLADFGGPYEIGKTASLECATLNTTACYASLDGGCGLGNSLPLTLTITRARQKSNQTSTAPTVWVIHDSLLLKQTPEQVIARFSQRSNATVYAVESRLFRDKASVLSPSSLTPCGDLAANYTSILSVDTTVMAAVTKCKTWLQSNFGTNGIRAYSVDSAAQDIALAISTVTKSANPLFLYASGRGSLIVSRLLAQTDLTIAGVIYDSPFLSPLAEEPVGSAMTRLVAACADDPYCRDKFNAISTSLPDMIKKTYATLDSSSSYPSKCYELLRNATYDPTRDLKPSHGLRRFFMAMRKSSASGAQAIPPILYRLERCAKYDIKFFERFFGKTSSRTLVAPLGMSPAAAFVDQIVSLSESWPTLQSRDKFVATFEASPISDGLLVAREPAYCAFTGSSDAACTELYKDGAQANQSTPLVYSVSKPATTKSDVLLLASRLSPIGAGSGASQVYDTITASKSSDQTVIMVQSDRLPSTEMEGTVRDSLLRVIDAFVTKRARGLNGKWHLSDVDSFALGASQPTAVGVVSSLDTKAANVTFGMSFDDSKTWFKQYNPYEGYKIIMLRRGEQDDPDLVDDGSGVSWELIAGLCVGAFGLLYILVVRIKMACTSCRPTAPPMYADTPVPLQVQWAQTAPNLPQPQQLMQPAQWPAPPPPPQWVQWQDQGAQQNLCLQQQTGDRHQTQQQLQPSAPPLSNSDGELVVQVHRL